MSYHKEIRGKSAPLMYNKPMSQSNTFKQKLRNSILRVSLTLVIVLSLVFFLVVSVLGVYLVSKNNREANEFVNQELNQVVLAYESYIEDVFEVEYAYHISDVLPGRQQLFDSLNDFVESQRVGGLFYVFNTAGEHVLSPYSPNPYNHPYQFMAGIFKQMNDNPYEVVTRSAKHQISNSVRTVFTIGKAIIEDEQLVGYIVFDLFEADLNNLVQQFPVDILVVTDRFQNSILSTDTTVLSRIGKFEPEISQNTFTSSIRDELHYISQSYGSDEKFMVYTLSSMQFINSMVWMGLVLLLLIVAFSFIGLIGLADSFSNRNTKALDELSFAIDEVKQGNLDVKLDIHAFDEFSKVSHYFNEMMDNLKSLIHENNELSQLNNLAEIKRLESQFNPHFMFNSLESLKYLIRMNPHDAEKFTLSLAKLMRYSVGAHVQFVTLEKDISYICNYLSISQYRYGDRLTYQLNLSEETKQAIIPKLIIQPLIENCLNHGYLQQAMNIKIESYKQDEHLVINVIDNGVGFSEERLAEINEILSSEDNTTQHIGLFNVHRRLVLQYGRQYGLSIQSHGDLQTKVQLVLPFQLHKELKDD